MKTEIRYTIEECGEVKTLKTELSEDQIVERIESTPSFVEVRKTRGVEMDFVSPEGLPTLHSIILPNKGRWDAYNRKWKETD